ncbi:uncharacterized protein LOC135834576 [Planococcus citri]|uniref:uncharacterized protein LOC135834576 n=1 Tax=Planococcus citri TaxID=170843 RepID=UPI0031F87888
MKNLVCRMFVVKMQKSNILHTVLLTLVLTEMISVEGKILIGIHVNSTTNMTVSSSGTSENIISDAEAENWGIWPEEKCKAVVKPFAKKTPDHCYLHEPTEQQIYLKNYKTQVTSVYEVVNISDVKVETKEVILATKQHENHSNSSFTVKYSLQKTVLASISHSTYSSSNVTVGGSAEFEIFGAGIGFNAEYKHVWGKAEEKLNNNSTSVGTETTITVLPHTRSTVTFKTRLGSMIFDMTVRNNLEGFIGTFQKNYLGKDAYNMYDVRDFPETKRAVNITEKITVNIYQDSYIEVDEQPI